MRTRGRNACGIAVATGALLLTGCTSSTTPAATTTPPGDLTSVSSTTAASTPATAPAQSVTDPSASPPTSSSAQAGPTGCTNADLTVRSTPSDGGASHGGIIIVFVNRTSRACTLFGYPGAADLDAAGRQFEQAARTLAGYLGGCGCTRPQTVRLAPGGAASSLIEGDEGGGDECLRGRAVLVTPPNTTRATRFAFEAYSCHLQVHPVVAGTAGRH